MSLDKKVLEERFAQLMQASDTQNRVNILRETNPRVTHPNEATQEVNPVTGQRYVNDRTLYFELEGEPKIYLYQQSNPTTPFIEYQFALARMEVRDGRRDGSGMSKEEYRELRRAANYLAKQMAQHGIPLEIMSSPDGFDRFLDKATTEPAYRAIQQIMSLNVKPKPIIEDTIPDPEILRLMGLYPEKPGVHIFH